MARFYSLRQLTGALIIDSEALVYGVLEGLRFQGGGAYLLAVVYVEPSRAYIDVEWVRRLLESRGVSAAGIEDVETLVKMAREHGVEVRYREAKSRVRLVKGLVPVSEVRLVDVKRVYRPGRGDEEVKVVLLSSPREARYRGHAIRHKPSAPKPDEVEGRLVVSETRGIIGYVMDVVIGPGELGLRVSVGGGGEEVNWIAFMDELRRRGLRRVYERLASHWNPYSTRRVSKALVVELLKSLGDSESGEALRLVDKHVTGPPEGSYTDIPWSSVTKVGDVVLVR